MIHVSAENCRDGCFPQTRELSGVRPGPTAQHCCTLTGSDSTLEDAFPDLAPCRMLDPELERYWMPVDLYVGGAEHAVLHLLYARFWHKVLHDIGVVSEVEPFQRLVSQGMILGETEYSVYRDADGNFTEPEAYGTPPPSGMWPHCPIHLDISVFLKLRDGGKACEQHRVGVSVVMRWRAFARVSSHRSRCSCPVPIRATANSSG